MDNIDLSPAFVRLAKHFEQRIVGGQWEPGHLIPGEEALAKEVGVSVGTVRKALDVLSGKGLISRHRGRGSFVSRATDERVFTAFFRIAHVPDGERRMPVDSVLQRLTVAADEQERAALGLKRGELVYRVKRRRELEARPVILELLSFRAEDLKGQTWEAADQTLMLVYSFLERRCGLSIQAATDRLRAMPCPKGVAADLGIAPGHPVLAITRVGLDLRGNAIELRRSWVCTDTHEYVSELKWSAN